MPNISLLPGEKEQGWDDLIAATDRGIAIIGEGSFSIDQQRYNAQFGGQVFYEIKGGKIIGMLKDVAYQMRTPEFWNSMDMIGGPKSYQLGGAFNDGKGQPSQSNAVSHGCVPVALQATSTSSTPAGRRDHEPAHACTTPSGALTQRRGRGARQAHARAVEGRAVPRDDHQHRARQHALRREPGEHRRRRQRHRDQRAERLRQEGREREHEQARRRVAQGGRRASRRSSRSSRPRIRS